MKTIKNIVLSLLTVLMITSLLKYNVNAANNDSTNNNDQIFVQEIENAILSGDGSIDNPYILDTDKAPNFTEYMNNKGEEALVKSGILESNEDQNITTYGLSGILKGTSHSGQTKGGYWKYSSGGMNVIYNGSITMKKVEYIGYAQTKAISDAFESSALKNTFKSILQSIVSSDFEKVVTILLQKGFATEAARGLAHWIGASSTLFSLASLSKEINDFLTAKMYKTAKNNGHGIVHAEFLTAYNGSWYAQSLTEEWTSYSTAYEPSTTYGKGTYKSNTK